MTAFFVYVIIETISEGLTMSEEKKAKKPSKPKLNKDGFVAGARVSFEDTQLAKIKAIAKQKADREKKAK